ncbi:MAG: DUF3127 domain-containing protein, partial [Bacteroidales bacterium]|nr:DUF3127 domain-containing protein [Bacteroidales bacterium]
IMHIGNRLNVSFELESREFNGRWYTDVRAWRIQEATMGGAPMGMPAAAPAAQPAPAASNIAAPNFPAPETPAGDSNDDLPF